MVPALSFHPEAVHFSTNCADMLRILLSAHALTTMNVFIGVTAQDLQFGISLSIRSQNITGDEVGHTHIKLSRPGIKA